MKRRFDLVVLTLFFLVLAVSGARGLWNVAGHVLRDVGTPTPVPTPCRIVTSKGGDRLRLYRPAMYWVDITFEFELDGQTRRARYQRESSSREFHFRHAEGRQATCYVPPGNPDAATLDDPSASSRWPNLLGVLIIIVPFGAGVAGCVWAGTQWRRELWPGPASMAAGDPAAPDA